MGRSLGKPRLRGNFSISPLSPLNFLANSASEEIKAASLAPGGPTAVGLFQHHAALSENKRSCFANHWEYSRENTRFQIDQPEQLDA